MTDIIIFLRESVNSIFEASDSVSNKLEAAYNLSGIPERTRCPKNLRANKHGHEYIRGYFGDNEDSVLNSVETMLKAIGIDTDNISLEYGMFKDASGKYNAVKVTSKDAISIPEYSFELKKNNYLYIVNTSIGNSKIRKKTLTPDNLGLTKFSFTSKNELVDKVEKGLLNSKLEDYTKAILSLCDCISGGAHDMTLDEILNNTISYTCDKSVIGDLTKDDFNNIANDFGEVLGPIMLMDKLKGDIELSYPTGSNAKLFDYVINDNIWISAKAGKGAIPSSVDTMKAIQELYAKGNIEADGDEKEFLENIVPIIADDEKKESGSAIRRQTWRLALYTETINSNIETALNILRNYGLELSEKGISESDIDKIYNDGNLETLLTEFYKSIAYKPSGKYSIDYLVNEYLVIDKKIKEGMILYPLKVVVTKYIDTKYSNYITTYANMVMNGYQMYFNHKIVGNNIELSFCPKQMSKGSFRLKAQGSVGDPLLKSMGIEMIQ